MAEVPAETESFSSTENPFSAKFEQFFKSACLKQVERLASEYPEKRSLNIDFKELEKFDYELADELLSNPDPVLEGANEAIARVDVPALEIKEFAPHVRFLNLPKEKMPLIREIGAEHLGKLIAVEGIVKQFTEVKPKLETATWECRRCGNTYRVEQEGQSALQPSVCTQCKVKDFKLVPEKSEFTDYQKISIQEPLERLKGGEQASNLDIYVSDDLVNKVSPGDRTVIVGVLRLHDPKYKGTVYERYLEAVHLEETEMEFEEVQVSPEEEAEIKKMAKSGEIYETLIQSIAPAIYGHELVKEAIALQLFSGVKKNLPDGTKVRGNIHILLVGDPGVAKSQLLQAADRIAPKSIYTAGKTSSGAGLCVGPDSLVLNDNGFVPIRDFVESRFSEESEKEEIQDAFSNEFMGKCPALGENLRLSEGEIYKIWRIKAPEKMLAITTQSGKRVELTPNTSLVRLRENSLEWAKVSELAEGDFVACPRVLPEGKLKNIPTISVIASDRNVKIASNVAEKFKEITDAIVASKGKMLQDIASEIGKARNTIYSWRNRKFYRGMPLHSLLGLAAEAGVSADELSGLVKEVFVSHGKSILVPRYLDDPDLAYLAGLALGDGNVWQNGKSASVRIFSADQQILDEVSRIVGEKFGVEAEKIDDGKRVPARRVKFRCFYEILRAFGLEKEKSRIRISTLASEMPNNALAALISGLFDTDGYAARHRHGSQGIGLSTISETLARTLQLSLLKFGIHSKIRKRARAGKVSVGKKITVRSNHNQYCVEITGKDNLLAFREKIGFRLERKRKALEGILAGTGKANTNIDIVPVKLPGQTRKIGFSRQALLEIARQKKDPQLEILANSDVFWEKVAKKEEFSPASEFVYDCSVKGTHNFVANGFIVHNTATATKDDFGEGAWTLKAGALVLANGGIAFVDEFDKMDAEDRDAMHEAMEQGMVSIAKAGIVTRFKTETSILAAANPKFARFDPFMNFMEQIDLPPTLISRFDLFFMIKDVLDRKKDTEIASHILQIHQFGETVMQRSNQKLAVEKEMAEKAGKFVPKISEDFLRKYISYARQNCFPVLSQEAIQQISDFYVDLREKGKKEGNYSATHRQLEALVRLSEASARIRLSDAVGPEDSERAVRIFRHSMEEVVVDPTTGKVDIDIITSGQAHSKTNELKKVLMIILSKAKEMDLVPLDEVYAEAASEGIDKSKVSEYISELKRRGEIYEPTYGAVKPADKK